MHLVMIDLDNRSYGSWEVEFHCRIRKIWMLKGEMYEFLDSSVLVCLQAATKVLRQVWGPYLKMAHSRQPAGAHLGGLFGCHDRPLCTAGTQHLWYKISHAVTAGLKYHTLSLKVSNITRCHCRSQIFPRCHCRSQIFPRCHCRSQISHAVTAGLKYHTLSLQVSGL